jgi:hypothetical protein
MTRLPLFLTFALTLLLVCSAPGAESPTGIHDCHLERMNISPRPIESFRVADHR